MWLLVFLHHAIILWLSNRTFQLCISCCRQGHRLARVKRATAQSPKFFRDQKNLFLFIYVILIWIKGRKNYSELSQPLPICCPDYELFLNNPTFSYLLSCWPLFSCWPLCSWIKFGSIRFQSWSIGKATKGLEHIIWRCLRI